MDMKRRNVLAAGAAGAAVALAGAGAASAATADGGDGAGQWDPNSLRALAGKFGLRIGTAISPQQISTPAKAAIASAQFSVVTPENAMKWESVEPTQGNFDWSGADATLAFAKANDQLVRGHTLCWHNQLPGWLTTGVSNGTINQTQLLDLLQAHIFTEAGRYRGRIWQWDVCNEFLTDSSPAVNPNDFWIKNAGPEVIEKAFRWAHEADPDALLFYNDYNIGGEDGTNAKFQAAFDLAQGLLQKGVPIHGVGIQGHLDTQYGWSPQRLADDIGKYASLGLKVAITEADVRTFVDAPTTQVPTNGLENFAQPFEFDELLKAALVHPELISFTIWGFNDADSWVQGFFKGEGYASIYDVSLNPKQAYLSMQSTLQLAAHGAMERTPTRNSHP